MTTKLLMKYATWVHEHKLPGQCKMCDYHHGGHHDYMTHIQNAHPDEYPAFAASLGLKTHV